MHIKYDIMFMAYRHTKFHMSSSNGSLVIAVKQKTWNIMFFYTLTLTLWSTKFS
jgi:hypothetical protein